MGYTGDIRTDLRFEKLPKWAQDGINAAYRERDNARTERDVARRESGQPDSEVQIVRGLRGENIPLPKRTTVRFLLGDDDMRQYVDVSVDTDRKLRLNSGDSLVIRPHVTNLVFVEVEQ